jgi:multidrug resistance efflux pump
LPLLLCCSRVPLALAGGSKLQQTQSSAPLQVAIKEADIKGQQANAEAAQAALAQSRLNLGYCSIAAPVSGVIAQR